jgi:molecular chaperone GrpE
LSILDDLIQKGSAAADAEHNAASATRETPETQTAPRDAQALEQELKEAAGRLARLQEDKEGLVAAMQRMQADFDNARKRIARERQEAAQRFAAQFVESLMPVLDAFERAFSTDAEPSHAEARRGYELIHRELIEILGRYGLKRIQAEGQPFDPRYHQAVERIETTDVPDGTVVEELRAGYEMRDRAIRPSLVRVAVAPAGVSADEPNVN